MESPLYSVEDLSGILKLHPKTIVRFIHEGKIKARKIGRAWMVSREDLREYAHAELCGKGGEAGPPAAPKYETLGERITVSAVIEISETNSEEASRISNSILAVLNCKDDSWGRSRFDFFHFPETGKAKYVLYGTPAFIGAMLTMFERICGR
jgi:excisionase family DNA binding protein